MWPSVTFWPNVFYNVYGDPRKYLLEEYKIDFVPTGRIDRLTMKSPNSKIEIKGDLGYIMSRGDQKDSVVNQFIRQITQTAIHYNSKEDYKSLSKKYDYVVVATGKDAEAREMGVWEDEGIVTIVGANIVGSFSPLSAKIYLIRIMLVPGMEESPLSVHHQQ